MKTISCGETVTFKDMEKGKNYECTIWNNGLTEQYVIKDYGLTGGKYLIKDLGVITTSKAYILRPYYGTMIHVMTDSWSDTNGGYELGGIDNERCGPIGDMPSFPTKDPDIYKLSR